MCLTRVPGDASATGAATELRRDAGSGSVSTAIRPSSIGLDYFDRFGLTTLSAATGPRLRSRVLASRLCGVSRFDLPVTGGSSAVTGSAVGAASSTTGSGSATSSTCRRFRRRPRGRTTFAALMTLMPRFGSDLGLREIFVTHLLRDLESDRIGRNADVGPLAAEVLHHALCVLLHLACKVVNSNASYQSAY